MKKFFHSHSNFILGALALLFLGVLLAFFIWAVDDVFSQVRLALAPPTPQSAEGFDLTAASKLDLRGLVNGVPAPSTPATPAVNATTPTLTLPTQATTTTIATTTVQ
ncbi:MAG TPA: hypothetical protein VMR99_03045 [Candidatus Paceibacterota bacterium]|nr:hypothetical protein [Candidatus Paceibacterota bacterium]